MKFFPVNPVVDEKIEYLLREIRHLKDGETAELIEKSGAHYRVNYGVSLVYLRKMGGKIEVNDALAQRLWYRQIRETMIIATMVADFDAMGLEELTRWGEMLNTIELSEQIGRNLLVNPGLPAEVFEKWLRSGHFYRQYAAAMGVGWRIRMNGKNGFSNLSGLISLLNSLVSDPRLHRALGFVLKMMGRFLPDYASIVLDQAKKWEENSDPQLKQLGEDVKFEIEAFM